MTLFRPHLLAGIVLTACCLRAADLPRTTNRPARTYRNPIIDRIGPADPHVIRHDGKYYLYPTTDGRGYDVFVSTNLVDWEQKPKCFIDSRGGAWAPDVFHHKQGDRRFYLYYTLNKRGGRQANRRGGGGRAAGAVHGPHQSRGQRD
jgi:beta-xylosidase